jgi:hypothetical protein
LHTCGPLLCSTAARFRLACRDLFQVTSVVTSQPQWMAPAIAPGGPESAVRESVHPCRTLVPAATKGHRCRRPDHHERVRRRWPPRFGDEPIGRRHELGLQQPGPAGLAHGLAGTRHELRLRLRRQPDQDHPPERRRVDVRVRLGWPRHLDYPHQTPRVIHESSRMDRPSHRD